MPTTLRLVFPLPAAFGAGADHAADRLTVIISAFGAPNEFKTQDIGTVLGADYLEPANHRQVYCRRLKGEKIGVTATLHVGAEKFVSGSLNELTLANQMQFDTGLLADDGDGDPPRVLLRGSIAIPAAGLLAGGDDQFGKHIASLWPTNSASDVLELRLEPTGLHLLGRMPRPFFPPLGPAERPGVVLRIPQLESDHGQWTMPTFNFDSGIKDARDFVQSWKEAYDQFRNHGKTFLDNLVCSPDGDCRVVVKAVEEFTQISWTAERIGTRVTLGVEGGKETSFFPDVLQGKLLRDGDDYKADGDVTFASGEVQPGDKPQRVTITQLQSALPVLEFESLDCAAVSIPNTRLSKPDGQLVLDKPRPLATPSGPVQVERPIRRSWLCTRSGWICLDTLEPVTKLRNPDEIPSSEALRSPVPLSEWMELLQVEKMTEPVSGMTVELEAIGRAPGSNYEQTRLELNLSADGKTLRFVSLGAKVILKTPAVWFRAPETANEEDRADQAVARSQVPSLTIESLDDPNLDPEERLRATLVAASFMSEQVLEPESADLGAVDGGAARRLKVTVSWAPEDKVFTFAFEKLPLTVWSAPTNLPIVQTTPLSPASPRDMFLDANRGLIPYRALGQGQERIEVKFPAKELPSLQTAIQPITPLPDASNDTNWQIPKDLGRVRYFLPTLPGLELDFPRINDSKSTWCYRHSVPVLDEAYTEVVEADTPEGAPAVPVEHTRIQNNTAFDVVGEGEPTKSSGWMLPGGAGGTSGTGNLTLTRVSLQGRNPELGFQIAAADNFQVNFSRPTFPVTAMGQSELTLGLSAKPTGAAADLTPFEVKWDTTSHTAQELVDSDWPRPLRILNNGQPLVARRLADDRVVTLDGEGVVRIETADSSQIIERRPDGTLRKTLTARWKINDTMFLDVESIVLNQEIGPESEQLGNWTFHDGSGDFPTWRSLSLLPLRLIQIDAIDNGYRIALEVAPLWRKPTLDAENVAGDWADSWRLTLEATDESAATLTSVSGVLDWRFPQSATDQGGLRLARIRATITSALVSTLDSTQEFGLRIDELAVEQADIGLVRVLPGPEASLRLTSLGLAKFAVSKRTAGIDHRLNGEFKVGEMPGPVTDFKLLWLQNQQGAPSWQLLHGTTEDLRTIHWRFYLQLDAVDLIAPPVVTPQRVGPRKFLFQVAPSTADESPEFKRDERAWFAVEATTGGFIGVEFAPLDNDLVVNEIAADMQVLLVDAPFRLNDAIHVYDHVKNELITIDRDTGDIFEPKQLTDVGVAALTGRTDQILWGTRNLGIRRWLRPKNVVDSQFFVVGVGTAPLPLPGGDSPITVRSLGVMANREVVILDEEGNLRFWDFADPERRLINQGDSNQIIESNLRDDLQALVTTRRYFSSPNDSVVAWCRTKSDGSGSLMRVWDRRVDPLCIKFHVDTLQAGVINALDILPDLSSIISGDSNGDIQVWQKGPPDSPVTMIKTIKHGLPVTAVAALGDASLRSTLFVAADAGGNVKLWDAKVVEADPNDHGPASANPPQVLVLSKAVKGLAALKLKKTPQLITYSFAILLEDGTVSVATVEHPTGEVPQFAGSPAFKDPEVLDLRGTVADSINALPDGTLLISGRPLQSRLNGRIKIERRDGRANVSLEATGWMTLENDLRFTSKMVPADNDDPTSILCTHQIRIHLDRARLPLLAVFQGLGPAGTDQFISGVCNHTFRFGSDPQKMDENLQVERAWQCAQRIRLSTIERTTRRLRPNAAAVAESQKGLLSVDASSVQWLAWEDLDEEVADFRVQSTSEIRAPGLRIGMRPRRSGRFQFSNVKNGTLNAAARLLRLPFVAAPGWVRLQGPVGNAAGPPVAFHTIEIPVGFPQQDSQERLHPTSGIQAPLSRLPEGPDESEIAFVERTSQSGVDSKGVKFRIADFRDALWLDERFLSATLSFPDPSRSGVVPVWDEPAEVALTDTLQDLRWLQVWEPRSNADSPATPATVKEKRKRPALLAATVTSQHNPQAGPQSMMGPTLFEFPYELEAERLEVVPAGPVSTTCDVQLVVFGRGRLVRIASDRIVMGNEKAEEAAAAWGHQVMLARRRQDAAFVLIDFRDVALTASSSASSRAELTSARPWDSPMETRDRRRRLPVSTGLDDKTQVPSIVGDPGSTLLIFDADPEPRVDDFPGIAATRFRLAPRSKGGNGVLQPARLAISSPGTSNILACTTRDEMPFEIVVMGDYPTVDVSALNEHRIPALTTEPQTLWPPLWDCVSWAARPGESYRTHWNLERIERENSAARPVRHQGAVTSALLRRPRALAARTQSVRLAFADDPSPPIGNGRFRNLAFLLTQILDRTQPPKEGNLEMVVTTRSEVFRGRPTMAEAKALPARVFATDSNTPPKIKFSELFILHLIPGPDYEAIIKDTDDNARPSRRTILLWLKAPLSQDVVIKTQPDGSAPFTIGDVLETEAKFVAEIPSLSQAGEDQFWIPDTSTGRLRAQISFAPPASPEAEDQRPTPELPVGGTAVWTLCALQIIKSPPAGEGGDPVYKPSDTTAAVAVAFLDGAGKLRAPKTSVSVLAESFINGVSIETTLAGYGRLSDEAFNPVQPQQVAEGIEWRRTAGLNVLHRALREAKYQYDVVTYGSGGEVFPTESTTSAR